MSDYNLVVPSMSSMAALTTVVDFGSSIVTSDSHSSTCPVTYRLVDTTSVATYASGTWLTWASPIV